MPPSAAQGARYRRREIDLAVGGRLILDPDGSIRHVDGEGATKQSWAPEDPDWARQAIRFGVRPQSRTVAPNSRRVRDGRPSAG
jgi:hypothetical protein